MYREEELSVPYGNADLDVRFCFRVEQTDEGPVVDLTTMDILSVNDLNADCYSALFLEDVLDRLAQPGMMDLINEELAIERRSAEIDREYDRRKDDGK